MDSIARQESPLSIRQLAQELQLPKSVVHRLLVTLEQSEYLQRSDLGYKLGMKLWWLGCSAIRGLELQQVARPYLEELAAKTRELVNIAIRDGKEVFYIDKLDSRQSVRAYIPIGGRAPAHCVATGKAILAHSDRSELNKILSETKRFTDKTIIGVEAIGKHLDQVRVRGYSINLGEYHSDVGGIAAPIWNAHGRVTAAIGVTAPIHRLTEQSIPRLTRLTKQAAERISRALGFDFRIAGREVKAPGLNRKSAPGNKAEIPVA